jgi:hypothetical protein
LLGEIEGAGCNKQVITVFGGSAFRLLPEEHRNFTYASLEDTREGHFASADEPRIDGKFRFCRLDGKLSVDDIPRIWDAKMQQYLGLSTEALKGSNANFSKGALQDVHWCSDFGYFPT